MPNTKIQIIKEGRECLRCGNKWVPRVENPIECPVCKSRDWNKEKEK